MNINTIELTIVEELDRKIAERTKKSEKAVIGHVDTVLQSTKKDIQQETLKQARLSRSVMKTSEKSVIDNANSNHAESIKKCEQLEQLFKESERKRLESERRREKRDEQLAGLVMNFHASKQCAPSPAMD